MNSAMLEFDSDNIKVELFFTLIDQSSIVQNNIAWKSCQMIKIGLRSQRHLSPKESMGVLARILAFSNYYSSTIGHL